MKCPKDKQSLITLTDGTGYLFCLKCRSTYKHELIEVYGGSESKSIFVNLAKKAIQKVQNK